MDSEKEPDIQARAPLPASDQVEVVSGEQGQASQSAGAPGQLHLCFHCAGELVDGEDLVSARLNWLQLD